MPLQIESKVVCSGVGREFVYGYNYSGILTYDQNSMPKKIKCPNCGKLLKPQTTVGECETYFKTRIFSYVRYHKVKV